MQEKSFNKIGKSRLSAIMRRAKLVIYVEKVWPVLFAFFMLSLTFLALSWLGLWLIIPGFVKIVFAILFTGGVLACLWCLARILMPDEETVVRHVETVSGIQHRPLTASIDDLADKRLDEASPQAALWRAHKARIVGNLAKLKAGWPSPQVERIDPYGLRTIVVLAAFIGFNVAGSDRFARLGDIADFSVARATTVTRLDAWVTPPRYTLKPPIFLTRDTFDPESGPVIVPAGSVVTIRSVNADNVLVSYQANEGDGVVIAAKDAEVGRDRQNPSVAQGDYEFSLERSGVLSVGADGTHLGWTFDVVADMPPTISFAADPEIQRSGAVQVAAILQDDYGVTKAEGLIELSNKQPLSNGLDQPRPLYEAPEFPLSLNRGRVKDGISKTLRNIVDHPWAGAEVSMTLKATDQAGQTDVSDPVAFVLPLRRFTNPLARSLVEQRRLLAMDANYTDRLADILDVLTIRPERFDDNLTAFITLATIKRGLLDARDDDGLRQVVDELWDLAVGIEDGNLSDAERDLRNALEALREGIENGASQDELDRLMAQAREALQEFMQALAEQAERNQDTAQNNQQQADQPQTLTPKDLQDLLNRIEELARNGSRDSARQLLSQMQQMMENLQANRNGQNQQGQSQAQQMLNELGEMIRQQQQLMDETFRQQNPNAGQQSGQQEGGRGEREQNGQGQGEGQGQGRMQGLQNGQQQLADRLRQFLDRLGNNSDDPGRQLGEAQRSMRGAAGQLQQGDLGGAGDQQAQALNQLRRGARGLSERMAGEGQGEGNHNLAQGDRRSDPLGRREGRAGADFGDNVEVPDEIDIQRAREILDQIRSRLGESLRPKIELDYLERLLRSE